MKIQRKRALNRNLVVWMKPFVKVGTDIQKRKRKEDEEAILSI
jgi:hypothetical protein